MEMYDEHCINTVPLETPKQKNRTKWQLPHSTSQAEQTPFQETISRDVLNRRDQTNKDLRSEGMDGGPSTLTSDDTLGVNTMSSTIPITVMSSIFSNTFAEPTTEGIESRRTSSQGSISTLSSVVRPMPTTATRTIAITREES